MEVSFSTEPEIKPQACAFHFEPGIHPQTNQEIAAIYSSFTQGNLDAHEWNKEVGERIASYGYNSPALLLTIDGLEPIPHVPNRLFSTLQKASAHGEL